jgi:hypothetical protein
VNVVFSGIFWKNTQKSNFVNILPMGGELLHVDKQKEMKKQTADFRNFANALKHNDI